MPVINIQALILCLICYSAVLAQQVITINIEGECIEFMWLGK